MSQQSCLKRAGAFFRSAPFKLYCSYSLSTWADRLWQFALTFALTEIGGLRLIAINGLVNGLAILFFASSVGKWIDETKRISAARITLTLTNGSVALSAICLILLQHWDLSQIWSGTLRVVVIVLAILLSTVAILAQTGTKIVLTKDWVVVMCNNEQDKLADMNAWLLRIDLAAMILSPLKAGLLMTQISVSAGCLFVAIWTVCSWGVEFWLLNVVYRSVPILAAKQLADDALETINPASVGLLEPESSTKLEDTTLVLVTVENRCAKFGSALRAAIFGWRSYYNQPVFPVALSLALLYLTVLDFDGITTGYAYSQGVSLTEWKAQTIRISGLAADVLAVFRSAGALMGIIGSVIYPFARSKIGLIQTGLISFLLELFCLALCILSIWLPGSLFDPMGYFTEVRNTSIVDQLLNSTAYLLESSAESATGIAVVTGNDYSYCSIWTFILGVVLARCGLWMVDLSITQIMQESIAEHERGVVNGVQSSTNQLLSMIKDTLVIILPDPRTFGLLIIISWLSILFGFLSYSVYLRRIRDHLLPFHRQVSSLFSRKAASDEHNDNEK